MCAQRDTISTWPIWEGAGGGGWKGPGRERYCVVESNVGVRMYWKKKLEKLAGAVLERVKDLSRRQWEMHINIY